nr:hypothetical protein CFP56_13038 [Quercus suber]
MTTVGPNGLWRKGIHLKALFRWENGQGGMMGRREVEHADPESVFRQENDWRKLSSSEAASFDDSGGWACHAILLGW